MEDLFIKGDTKLPTFHFKYGEGLMEIRGRSWPEHALNIYKPAFDWAEEYLKSPKEDTQIKIALEYFNTISSKVIVQLLKLFEPTYQNGMKINVSWMYEEDDVDLKEEGQTIKESVNLPVELVTVEEFESID